VSYVCNIILNGNKHIKDIIKRISAHFVDITNVQFCLLFYWLMAPFPGFSSHPDNRYVGPALFDAPRQV
jgi:hypothetical protein